MRNLFTLKNVFPLLEKAIFHQGRNRTITVFRPCSTFYSTNMSKNMTDNAAKRIVWVDLEMTGLNVESDKILEVACLITDANLNIVAMGPDIVIHQPNNVLDNMDSWCVKQHGETGMTKASKDSKVSLEEAENQLLKFVKEHVPRNRCPLAGNSVYMDRLFLMKYMPNFNQYLHYRIIDVSTIKELAKRWYSKEFSRIPQKKFKHRSLEDIQESVEELKYYRENIFKTELLYH